MSDPLSVFMGEEPDEINAAAGLGQDSEAESGHIQSDPFDEPDDNDTSESATPTQNTSSQGQGNRNKQNILTEFRRSKKGLSLLAVKNALSIAKFEIGIGRKANEDEKMTYLAAYVDAIEFANWLDVMRYGTAKALVGSEEGLGFASYGGGSINDMLVSRQFFINREAQDDGKISYSVTVRHVEGVRNDQGGIMPKNDGKDLGRNMFRLDGHKLAELGLRCQLALTNFASSANDASMKTLYGDRDQ